MEERVVALETELMENVQKSLDTLMTEANSKQESILLDQEER